MLTIENINKIIGNPIAQTHWYVSEIKPLDLFPRGTTQAIYSIKILNLLNSRYVQRINLYREPTSQWYEDSTRWYELSCDRKGKRYEELLTMEMIMDIQQLLEHIKIVAID